MKYKLIAIASLTLSVIAFAFAVTAGRRAQAAAERAFASQRADLERQIMQRVLAQLPPTNAPIVYSVANGPRGSDRPVQPDQGLWYPTLPPKRVD